MAKKQEDIYVVFAYRGNCIKGRLYMGLNRHNTVDEAIKSCMDYHECGYKSVVAKMPPIEWGVIEFVIMRERGLGKSAMVRATRPDKITMGVRELYRLKGNRLVSIRRLFHIPYNIWMYEQKVALVHHIDESKEDIERWLNSLA